MKVYKSNYQKKIFPALCSIDSLILWLLVLLVFTACGGPKPHVADNPASQRFRDAKHLLPFEKLSVAVYVGMGWICLIAFKQIMIHVPLLSVVLMALGGLSYTLGVIFYAWRKLPYNHGIWHLFVLGGSTFHFFSVLFTLRSL